MADTAYRIHLDPKFPPLTKIDLQELVDACADPWFNQTLCEVNESVVRLGIVQGEFHWHKHDDEDEFFYVVNGRLIIELEEPKPSSSPPSRALPCPAGWCIEPVPPSAPSSSWSKARV
jgi:hypothetical protein